MRLLTAILLLLVLAPSASAQAVDFGQGGWSWFQDPRGLTHTGAHTRTYTGWVTPGGDVAVGSYDHTTKDVETFTLRAALQTDDHVSPALLMRPDGRLTAFYAKHSGAPFYYRTTVNPEDVTSWGPEATIETNNAGPYGFTYPNPVRLPAEDKTYLFWRGGNLDAVFSTQDDGATGWDPVQGLIHVPNNGPGPDAERPYVKYASDGRGTIHFAYTNAHPTERDDVNIYYGRIRDGKVETADGQPLSDLGTPFAPGDADKVFDPASASWIHDVAVGRDGNPVVVFATFPGGATGHVYHYARWDGTAWQVREIVAAGGSISTGGRSPLYSGGITLDHDDPTTVYLSRQAGPAFNVEVWRTPDGGATWTSRVLTPGSTVKNVRPFSPRGDEPGGETVMWMSGTYTNYNTFQTQVTALTEELFPPPAPAPAPVAPGPPPRVTDVRLARASASTKDLIVGPRGGARLTVRCRAATKDRCKVAGSLRRDGRRTAAIAGNVGAGKLATVRVRLTPRALRGLKRTRRLRVRVLATSSSLSGRAAPLRGKVRLVLRRRR